MIARSITTSQIPTEISSHLGVSFIPPNDFTIAITWEAIIASQISVYILFVFVKKFLCMPILAFLWCKFFDLPVNEELWKYYSNE